MSKLMLISEDGNRLLAEQVARVVPEATLVQAENAHGVSLECPDLLILNMCPARARGICHEVHAIMPELPLFLIPAEKGHEMPSELLDEITLILMPPFGDLELSLQIRALLRLRRVELRLRSELDLHAAEVAERRRALRQSDERLAQIIEANSIATFVIDERGLVTHWNRACEKLTGIEAGEIMGRNRQWQAFYREPHPVLADLMLNLDPRRDIVRSYGDKARPCKLGEGAWEAEDFYPAMGERGRWLYFTAAPLRDLEGRITGAIETVQDVTERKLAEDALRHEVADLEQELKGRHKFQSMIGQSRPMQSLYGMLDSLGDTDSTVLITGESGTGKELVAKALHYTGLRSSRTMVSLNCSALSENLLESELFGHVKGAFTGAYKDKMGRFQLAQGGTIFLDEIGDISPRIQLKLLRVLQEREFERVGDSRPLKSDVRILAATNRDLRELVRLGEFREDLYYRLKVVEIELPPLRERLEDIPLLVGHFLDYFNQRLGKQVRGVSDEVLGVFMAYAWPGNVRELEHAMEHAFILCHSHLIIMEHLPQELRDAVPRPIVKRKCGSQEADDVLAALKEAGWNKSKAARRLGVSRPTLYQLMKRYKIEAR